MARAVGQALKKNSYPFDSTQGRSIKIPCHRVVKSDGGLGGYKGGVKRKARLLKGEGVLIKNNKIFNLKKFLI